MSSPSRFEGPHIVPISGPRASVLPSARAVTPLHRQNLRTNASRLYNWTLWTLLTVIIFAQFFGVIWSSVTTTLHFNWGQSPLLGTYSIPGFNDEPYTDRAVACRKYGHMYRPVQLSQLLKQWSTVTFTGNSTHNTNGIDGYRVVSRDSFKMDAATFSFYKRQCNTIMLTLENIFNACDALGYNVTRDVLRVVDGVESSDVVVLDSTLPVLIIPYWDYGALSRYVVPGHDGSACVFRGSGTFENEKDGSAVLSAVTRSVREEKTEEWLRYPGGIWRNGWYEDPVVHMKWYSDVISSQPHGPFGIDERQFDLLNDAKELTCSQHHQRCEGGVTVWSWNEQLTMKVNLSQYHSIAISNGSRFGLFLFDGLHIETIKSRYSLEKLISNASFAVLLSQWFVAMIALSPHHTIGIGAIANTRSFYLLPIFLLPRLKSALEAFWSFGCEFEGDERALADAWFEVYPAIGEIVLVYFSLLNTLAKVLRRRVTDAMFGPTLLFFASLHFFRSEIAAADFLEFNKRISTVITADEVAASTLLDFFTTDLAFRMNGKIKSLYWMKVAVFWLNAAVVLLFSRRVSDDCTKVAELQVETALSKHFLGNAGLGSTATPYVVSRSGEGMTLRPCELLRGDYVAITFRSPSRGRCKPRDILLLTTDWFWLLVTTPVRRSSGLVLRIVVYDLEPLSHGELQPSATPRVLTVADSRFDGLPVWSISAPAIR